MDVFEFPFALMAFLGFVAIVPPWMWFISQYPSVQNLSLPSQFLINMLLPALVLLGLASWIEGGSRA